MDSIERTLFVNRMQAICEEMGAVLRVTVFSSNIKERMNFSCATFDASNDMCAQAAHISVHLGSITYAMRAIIQQINWQDGDVIIINDPSFR